ncbi:MAG: TVP38/TMEM64 family protein [Chloroflexota bacterium]|nr:TVP38/TMEM64 family protein [Chloroflexota bacterium]
MALDERTVQRLRFGFSLGIVLVGGLVYLVSDTVRGETNRAVSLLTAGDIGGVRDFILSFGAWAPIVSALLMILQALAAPLPAFVIGFANGLAFGAFWGGMLSLVSATAAAALSFGLARALGRTAVQGLVGKAGLESADRWFARHGVYAVLVARLVPLVSFDVISYAAGLTKMGFWGFLGATVLGMAPATFLYSYLGEQAPQYVWVLLVAFGVVIVAAGLVALVRRQRKRT